MNFQMRFPLIVKNLVLVLLLGLGLMGCVHGVPAPQKSLGSGVSKGGDAIGSALDIYSSINRIRGNSPGEFRLHVNAGHSGYAQYFGLGDICSNLEGWWNDAASSVDTLGNCLILYADSDCSGAEVRIAPGTGCHSNLGDCGFNDRASSYSSCDY